MFVFFLKLLNRKTTKKLEKVFIQILLVQPIGKSPPHKKLQHYTAVKKKKIKALLSISRLFTAPSSIN